MKKALSQVGMRPVEGSRYSIVALATASLMLSGCVGKSAEDYLARAREDLAKKDNASAIVDLKNALQKKPSLAEARLLLGNALLANGDASGAEIELTKARDDGANADAVLPSLAFALLQEGKFDRVLSDFGNTKVNSASAQSSLQTVVALAYSAKGQQARAMDMLKTAVAADPDNVHALVLQGRLMAMGGDVAGASQLVNDLVTRFPKSSEAWQLKAGLLTRQGKSDDALAADRQAVALSKGNMQARADLFLLLLDKKDFDGAAQELKEMKAAKASGFLVRKLTTLLALERNDLNVARDNVQAMLKVAPGDLATLYLSAVVSFRRGEFLEAQSSLNKIVTAAPSLGMARVLLARTDLKLGDPGKALDALQGMIGDDHPDVTALGVAAEAYLQQGDLQRAQKAYALVSKLHPSDAHSGSALALVEIAKGQLDEGVANLQAISSTDTGTTADMALITTFMSRHDWSQALKAIDHLAAKMPGQAMPADLRGNVLQAAGRRDEARAAYEAALKLDPLYLPAVSSLADFDMQDKHPDAAKARFKAILDKQPNNLPANMALIALSARTGASKEQLSAMLDKLVRQMPTEVKPRVALVEVQLERKDFVAAKASAQEAVAVLPDAPDAWRVLAQAQALSGDVNQAIISLNKWATLAPKSPDPALALAAVYAKQGDTASQIQSIKHSLSIKPDYPMAQMALYAAQLDSGHFAEALQVATTFQAQHPDQALGRMLSGDVAARQKNWAVAATEYRAGLKLQPAATELAVKLHRTLLAAGKSADAKALESEWTAAHPQDVEFLGYLGTTAMFQQDYDLAERRYLEALKIQPDNPGMLNNMAWLLDKSKKQGALAYAEKANSVAPNQPDLMDTLAQVYASAGQWDKAVDVQKRAVGLAPDTPSLRLNLARYDLASGNKTEARTELKRLADLGDKFDQQAEVKRLLAQL